MSGSLLIYGGNKESREEVLKNLLEKEIAQMGILMPTQLLEEKFVHPDLLTLNTSEEHKSIGIDDVREGISFLQKKPFTWKKKYLIILNAEKLTDEAQNALLKTLEEPPTYANIILLAKTEDTLLPTVVSRCTKRRVAFTSEKNPSEKQKLADVIKMTLGERLDWVGNTATEEKEDIIEMLEEWMIEEHSHLSETKNTQNLVNITKVKEDLENTNINMRLALETLLLSLKPVKV
ncbi:hypothetical protein A3K42_00705 [candidate division WWE3 bacterium RBG_13_37_7]|uniref:DNA polymerase III subunit delta n=1 Tax=candidate division WWE3 bacterium RBG_13_37_7 TaxID=1802609 RepID=A0A1F4U107_UNCKA|nr:MAG: hypothetical protein A3K42_00705 [candidate division WWE3 bacterium RBG_13_37_7]